MRRRVVPILLVASAIIAVPVVLLRSEAARGVGLAFIATLQRAGPMGLASFFGAQIAVSLLALPIWLMSGIAGYVYGFPRGLLIALPGQTLAACVSFLVGRALFRRRLAQRAGDSRFLRGVHRAVQTDGLKIVILLRIAIVLPQPVLNYLLSTTPLRLKDLALGTLVGLFPATLLHVYLGSIVSSAAALLSGEARAQGPLAWATLGLGLAATVAALLMTSRLAKRALESALAAPGEGAS